MQKNVETLIGRLATDAALRRRFSAAPVAVLAELSAQGLELTAVEQNALATTDLAALHRFASTLDGRLRRASLTLTPEEK